MLDGYGLHSLTWNLADQAINDILVASPMDAEGRGIALAVRQNGTASDLDGATAYLIWTHRSTGKRGTTTFDEVDASVGTFRVFYPAAMCESAGVVDAAIMLSLGDDQYIATRGFLIRVERVLVDGLEPRDGFTLFVEAIAAYEHAADISTEAADAATAAAEAVTAAMERGDFDGEDGFSPVATVTQTASGATITITDANGTTTASIANGAKGDKGDTGAQGPKGDTGERGPQGIQGEVGPKGEKGDTGATGAQGPKGDTGETGATGAQGPKGDKGDTGAAGPQGPQGIRGETGPQGATGAAGADGADGSDGVSCTHSWNGTVLSVTSASGTSSADLVGPQGPTGATGATGPQGPAGADGADGTVFTPVAPLALAGGELSLNLRATSLHEALTGVYDFTAQQALPAEGTAASKTFPNTQKAAYATTNDLLFDTIRDRVATVQMAGGSGSNVNLGFKTIFDLAQLQGIVCTTTADAAAGSYVDARVGRKGHALTEGTLVLNTSTGNLMRVNATVIPFAASIQPEVRLVGLGNVFGGGTSYTATSPLSIDANNDISIDLTGYAALTGATFTGAVSGVTPTANAHLTTKQYVDQAISDAIAALDDLSEESF